MTFNFRIATGDGEMGGYLALPPSGKKAPGIVLLQEIFGVNVAMREVADKWAAKGYSVLVPDLFWRIQPGVELGYSEADRKQAFGLWQKFDNGLGAEDSAAAAKALSAHDACTGKIACMGFCLGGKMAVLAAARGGASAVISYYGVKLQEDHEALIALHCPIQLHVGDADAHVPMDVVRGLQDLLKDKPGADVFVYPGAVHAFANHVRTDIYAAEAAQSAETRAERLLASALA